jgi:hypothetical protein
MCSYFMGIVMTDAFRPLMAAEFLSFQYLALVCFSLVGTAFREAVR